MPTPRKRVAQIVRGARIVMTAGLFAAFAAAFPARAEMEPQPVAKLRSLDKITARTMTFEAEVGSTVKFGPLFIKVRACHKAPPIDAPESAAFLQIWENSLKDGTPQWVFSGWMFASSPALSPMDHPVYDVWVLDCLPHKGAPPESAAVGGTGSASGKTGDKDEASPAAQPGPAPVAEEDIVEEDIVEEEAPPAPGDEGRTPAADENAAGVPESDWPAPYDAPR